MDQVVILAGGHGSRMKAAIPKPMLDASGTSETLFGISFK